MKKNILIASGAAAVAIIVIAVMIISVRNNLIALDESVDEAWAQIETQLQRRMDLIPNLVKTVKGYAKHEKEVFTAVSEARSKLLNAKTPAQKAEADSLMGQTLGRLLAIAEKYPELKADNSFIRLQDELAGTENRIAVARNRYNSIVKKYNAKIRQFPGSMFAPGLGLEKREYFRTEDHKKAMQVPQVEFK
jgi:LemA protein